MLPERIEAEQPCYSCRETGKCSQCSGAGQMICSNQSSHRFHLEEGGCDWCGICPSCKGRGVNSQDCWKCKGTGEQETEEEYQIARRARHKQEYEQITENLTKHDVDDLIVDLYIDRRKRPLPPQTAPSPWTDPAHSMAIYEREMEAHDHVPEFLTHILIAEDVSLYDALRNAGKWARQAIADYGIPNIFHDYIRVNVGDETIGFLHDTYGVARFLYQGGTIEDMLLWWACTDLGKTELLELDFSHIDPLARDLARSIDPDTDDTIHGAFNEWKNLLRDLPLGQSTDAYLVILNDVRALAYKLYTGRTDIESYSYGY
jgi:hypothetical protein